MATIDRRPTGKWRAQVRREGFELSKTFIISAAHDAYTKVGLCGQAPSDHPAFAEFLVMCGINSTSVSPDSFIAVKQRVADAERLVRSTDKTASKPL